MKIQSYNNYNNQVNFYSRGKVSKEELSTLINNGYNYTEIGKYYGKSYGWAFEKVKRLNLITPTQHKIETIINLLKQGYSTTEIANKLGSSRQTIYHTVINHLGKDDFKEIKKEGFNNRYAAERELLKNRVNNNQGTLDIYTNNEEKVRGFATYLKQEESKLKKAKANNNINHAVNTVLEGLRQGLKLVDALKNGGICRETLFKYVDNDTIKNARKEAKQKDFNIIMGYLKEGYSIAQIAEKRNCSRDAIENILGKNSHWKEERDNYRINKIEKFLSWGYSYKEIADLLDISIRTIRNLMKGKNNK